MKQTWTEHQDEELRTLFEEFYQLPQDAAAEAGELICAESLQLLFIFYVVGTSGRCGHLLKNLDVVWFK